MDVFPHILSCNITNALRASIAKIGSANNFENDYEEAQTIKQFLCLAT